MCAARLWPGLLHLFFTTTADFNRTLSNPRRRGWRARSSILAAHFQHAYVTISTPFPQWRRLQEAILASPMGVSRLMDMMLEREVIRNEALLLLIFLTRSAEEIQKIVVFEGAFERLFKIVTEEGGSDGGIIVQDCLELLNNLLRNNPSNQVR